MKEFKNIEKFCECCGKKLKLNNTRDIIRKRFCGRSCNGSYLLKELWKDENYVKKLISSASTIESNYKKGHRGKDHPKWIEDRTKLKNKRGIYEEKEFFKEIIKERDYTCEITKCGGKLSVHHLDSVSLFPNKRYDKNNVIVILYDIHKDFHTKYGYINITKEKWDNYIILYHEKIIKTHAIKKS